MNTKNSSIVFLVDYILRAFDNFHDTFKLITRRAQKRFTSEAWQGFADDALERLELYGAVVDKTVAELLGFFETERLPIKDWPEVKAVFASSVGNRWDGELTKTFFNSVTRRIFNVVGVNPEIEFINDDFRMPLDIKKEHPTRLIFFCDAAENALRNAVVKILNSFSIQIPFADAGLDAENAADAIRKKLKEKGLSAESLHIEMVKTVFYRYKEAYLMGRIFAGAEVIPLVFCILNVDGRIFVNAILLAASDVSILFSFAHAYFHVDIKSPGGMVDFLQAILPEKRASELYNSLGYHKHGKAELYRELMKNLESSEDAFEVARGQKGTVMLVFTLNSFDVVFKIIKDRFDDPKRTTADHIKRQYQLVFTHDRVGRLEDIQEFEYLEFERSRFSETLIQELLQKAKNKIILTDKYVIIKHLYTQRRVTPLDLFINENPAHFVEEILIDYGWTIKELAASNIFPGDLFFKNFGVTRHGRVVFYDYDEVSLITDCSFRRFPHPRTFDEVMSGETWFPVYENDVFPEEFKKFLHFPKHVEETFENIHGDLFNVSFWLAIQKKIKGNISIMVLPYKKEARVDKKYSESPHYYFLVKNA